MATVTRSANIASTLFTSKITIDGDNIDVVFDGVDFTLNGYVEIIKAKSVTFRNCRVYGIVPNAAKSYWLKASGFATTVKLVFETCFFGANPANGSNKMYNLIEPQCYLADGSSFSFNYVNKESCTHNVFSVYGAAENANLNLNGNVLEINGFRIGMDGNPKCTITMQDNIVQSVITEVYAGLFLVQPWPGKTTSCSNMHLVLKNISTPTDRKYYLYSDKNYEFTSENSPKVTLDGKDQTFEELDIVTA